MQKLHQTNVLSFPAGVLHIYGLHLSPESATPPTSLPRYVTIITAASIVHNLCSKVSAARSYCVYVMQREELKDAESFNLCTVCHASVLGIKKGIQSLQ